MEINVKYNQLKELKVSQGKWKWGKTVVGYLLFSQKNLITLVISLNHVYNFCLKKKTISFLMAGGHESLVTIKSPALYME